MTNEELADVAATVNAQVKAITRARARLRGIHAALEANEDDPFEQDYIYERHFGSQPSKARIREINGVTITTRILHQTGRRLSDIAGADLLYEIPGKKYVAIQYKRVDANTRVLRDDEQLTSLVAECPASCHQRIRSALKCGSWYCVIDKPDTYILSACRARDTFRGRGSAQASEFAGELSHLAFDELFGKCYLGAPITFGDVVGQIERASATNRLLFSVVERRWPAV